MEVLAFNICGKFAHFRKFYSNSSALTHFIPPRTTIIGIIAAIIGLERDSYYEDFSLENCDIGIRLLSKVKKTIQKLKYLKVESLKDLNGSYYDPRQLQFIANTMVPFEVLSPLNIRENNNFVSYRIYYHSKTEKNDPHFEKLKKQFAKGKECYYPLSLGSANFTAFIDDYSLYSGNEVTIKHNSNIKIDSAIPKEYLDLEELKIGLKSHIIQETLPMDFDKERYLKSHSEILFDLNCYPLSVKMKSDYISLQKNSKNENIVFMQ
ncbi:MAG: CRISPR-associated protein Cas5 [Bacteroidales bacterium]|nr:CRISPR-associated protein Cas5 [Bacteroidales bacterium]